MEAKLKTVWRDLGDPAHVEASLVRELSHLTKRITKKYVINNPASSLLRIYTSESFFTDPITA